MTKSFVLLVLIITYHKALPWYQCKPFKMQTRTGSKHSIQINVNVPQLYLDKNIRIEDTAF